MELPDDYFIIERSTIRSLKKVLEYAERFYLLDNSKVDDPDLIAIDQLLAAYEIMRIEANDLADEPEPGR